MVEGRIERERLEADVVIVGAGAHTRWLPTPFDSSGPTPLETTERDSTESLGC